MLILALLLSSPVDLNTLPAGDAVRFDGLPVLASVEVVNPMDRACGVTYFGDDTRPDDWFRAVHLPGEVDVAVGERVLVVGRVRVLFHPPSVIDGTWYPPSREIRVVGWWKLSPLKPSP